MCDYSFRSENWSLIKYLELRDDWIYSKIKLKENCFSALKRLEELSFNIGGKQFEFKPGAFRGLESVTTLNLRDCVRMDIGNLTAVFDRKDELPNITKLSLDRMNSFIGSVTLNEQFCKSVLPRQINVFDCTNLQVRDINFCFINNFKKHVFFNMSSTTVLELHWRGMTQSDLQHVRVLDFSYIIPPKSILNIPPTKLVFNNTEVSVRNIIIDRLETLEGNINIRGNILQWHCA